MRQHLHFHPHLPAHPHIDWENPMTFVWIAGATLAAAAIVMYVAEALLA